MEEIETLKEQLRESEDFINRSNEEFIKEIHVDDSVFSERARKCGDYKKR